MILQLVIMIAASQLVAFIMGFIFNEYFYFSLLFASLVLFLKLNYNKFKSNIK